MKKSIILIVSIMLLILAGCNNQTPQDPKQSKFNNKPTVTVQPQQETSKQEASQNTTKISQDQSIDNKEISTSQNINNSSEDNNEQTQTEQASLSETDNNTNKEWGFGPKDILIHEKPILGVTYDQLTKALGTPQKFKTINFHFPGWGPIDSLIAVYKDIEVEFNFQDYHPKPTETEKTLRFDITGPDIELDCGLRVGLTVDEVIKKFGNRKVYNLKDPDNNLQLSDIKAVLYSYKPKDYYSGYTEAMVIMGDYNKYNGPVIAQALVLLIKNNKVDRIVYGLPTAG